MASASDPALSSVGKGLELGVRPACRLLLRCVVTQGQELQGRALTKEVLGTSYFRPEEV